MMAEIYSPLTPGEVELISAIYKMLFSDKYNALRTISRMKKEEQQSGKPAASVGLEVYLEVLEDDMERTCKNVLHIVQHHLLPFCSGEENVVLYTKMAGDINWILAMLRKVEDKELHVESTLTAYKAASKAAESLSAAHHLRLAVNLTKTAFYFDVMEWPELATAVAKLALDKAGPELASLDEESYKKSTEIMGLMEDNLKMWKKPTSPKSEDYSESENNIISFSGLASLSLDEAAPTYTNGSPSPPPPPPSPPVVPRSADYSENGNDTSFNPASLEAGPSNSNGSPSPPPPVIPRSAGPPVVSNEFISPGDWGYDFHEGLSLTEIRSRKKAAQIKRGRMG